MNAFSPSSPPIQSDWPSSRIEPVIQGEYRVSRDPEIVLSTVLGSCVSACIFDPVARVGGMNHFLLPGQEGSNTSELKYGAMAMELLINDLLKHGALRSQMRAKLFGGARVSASFSDIGEKNVIFARSYLQREGFQVVAESLGGQQARRLHFRPSTGAARLVMLPPTEAPPERRAPRPATAKDTGITLF
ncbi:MAG: chemotaxis protein CheD [Rhodovulum sp.]